MGRYTPVQLKRMASLALAARKGNDARWRGVLMWLMLATGLSSGEITIRLTEYAQALE